MAPINVHIKHAGKVFDVALDVALPALAFKESIYQVTGVPVDRMKVMVKGGMLKVRDIYCTIVACRPKSLVFRTIMTGRRSDQRRGRHSW